MVVFGTICVDRIRRVAHYPEPGGYVEVLEETVRLGGEAANTANALFGWGAPVTLCGNTLGGEQLYALLRETGLVNYDVLSGVETPTPVCDIYVTADGERTMFGIGFAGMEASVDVAKVPYAAGEWFTCDSNMPVAGPDACRRAQAAGMKVYAMDAEDAGPGWFWQSSTDWVGTRGDMAANVAWVQDWVAKTGCFAILTDGGGGLVAGSPTHPVRAYPVFPPPKIVDATGSGDMFRAGMLYGLEQGWEVGRCLAFAAAAGSLNMRSAGGTGDVPEVEEIETYLRTNPSISGQYF